MPIVYLRPLSDYFKSNGVAHPGGGCNAPENTFWDKVDEEVADDNDYIYAYSAFLTNCVLTAHFSLLEDQVPVGAFINNVTIHVRGSHSDGTFYVRLIISGTVYEYAITIGSSWEEVDTIFEINPKTGLNWIPEDVNSLFMAGVRLYTHNSGNVQCSQFYVAIDYDEPTQLSGIFLMPRFEAGSKQITLRGYITAGSATASTWFEYGLTTDYGSETSHQYPVFDEDFISHQCDLERNLLYHYRWVILVVDDYWYSTDQVIRIDDRILYKLGKLI